MQLVVEHDGFGSERQMFVPADDPKLDREP